MPLPRIDIRARFGWVEPTHDHTAALQTLRAAFTDTARTVLHQTPEGRYQSLAMTAIEEAAMWANKAVVQEGDDG